MRRRRSTGSRAALVGAVVAASLVWSAAAQADLRPTLVQALQRTNGVKSMHIALTERIAAAGQVSTVRMSGIEQPQARAGSFVVEVSPAKPGVGRATEIEHGSTVYLHYPILDTLRATHPGIKSWIAVDTSSSLGLDSAGLTLLQVQEARQLTGIEIVGGGTVGGMPVTRYAGLLDLTKLAQSKQLQQLLARLPSGAAAALNGTDRIVFSVGRDGLVHAASSSLTAHLQGGQSLQVDIDAAFSDFDRASAPILAPAAADVMTLAQFNALTSAAPSAADTTLLQGVVLEPSQIGPGFNVSEVPGGKLVQGEVTLDFCGLDYPSEALRTARLQVVYSAKSGGIAESNEVVTYAQGGAQQALREVAKASTTCPNGAVESPPSGITNLVRHTRVVTAPKLSAGSVAILETDTATVKGKRVTTSTMAIYQVHGNVLSGVYGAGRSAASVEALTLHAAAQSASNLAHAGTAAAGVAA